MLWSAAAIIPYLVLLISSCCGIANVLITISRPNPTRRSMTAKFISRKAVRFSLFRCFQNTKMVNRLLRKTITDSTMITDKITTAVTLVIVEDVLDVTKLDKRVRTIFY